jgi:hypothetical protein
MADMHACTMCVCIACVCVTAVSMVRWCSGAAAAAVACPSAHRTCASLAWSWRRKERAAPRRCSPRRRRRSSRPWQGAVVWTLFVHLLEVCHTRVLVVVQGARHVRALHEQHRTGDLGRLHHWCVARLAVPVVCRLCARW